MSGAYHKVPFGTSFFEPSAWDKAGLHFQLVPVRRNTDALVKEKWNLCETVATLTTLHLFINTLTNSIELRPS
jgi:hypothetical protein